MAKKAPQLRIFHGDDEFAITEALQKAKAHFTAVDTTGLNFTELDGQKTTIGALRAVTDAVPFLADSRLVVLRDVIVKGRSKQGLFNDLLDYLPSLPSFTNLIIIETKVIQKNSRLLKLAAEHPSHAIKLFGVPKGEALQKWIVKRTKQQGGEISPQAAAVLAAAINEDPRVASQEIEKLLLYTKFERPISPDDVELLTPAASNANIFDYVDALGGRNARKAFHTLQTLLSQPGQEPMQVFSMIVRQYRLLLLAREVMDQGGNDADVMKTLGVHSFVARKLVNQARRFRLSQLEKIYRRLLELDIAMKSGSNPPTVLDTLTAGLTI